jgi:hypothetical protein
MSQGSNIKAAPDALTSDMIKRVLGWMDDGAVARRPLSQLQREALISLFRGWHFGIDHRTQRGLIARRLVYVRATVMKSGHIFALPHLTSDGRAIATLLHHAELEAAAARLHPTGMRVIDGGLRG